MRSSIFVSKGYLLITCFSCLISNFAFCESLQKSIIPLSKSFEINNIASEIIINLDGEEIVSVVSSIRPRARGSDGNIINKQSERLTMKQNKPKSKKGSRIYIMGNTVPIFKSVVPQTHPL